MTPTSAWMRAVGTKRLLLDVLSRQDIQETFHNNESEIWSLLKCCRSSSREKRRESAWQRQMAGQRGARELVGFNTHGSRDKHYRLERKGRRTCNLQQWPLLGDFFEGWSTLIVWTLEACSCLFCPGRAKSISSTKQRQHHVWLCLAFWLLLLHQGQSSRLIVHVEIPTTMNSLICSYIMNPWIQARTI